MSNTNYPFVSALLVTRNEGGTIRRALNSYLNQTYPKTCYEIIIVDGLSEDNTSTIIHEFIENYSQEISIKYVENPQKSLASGWNIGIKEALGEYVVRIDAHAEASFNFIELSVNTMLQCDAVCVGGKLITKTSDNKDNIISKVLSSPFGIGNSSFRVSNTPRYTDTAVYGLYKKAIFDKVGLFNDKMLRNQDLEMHSRIKQVGGRFYFNPQITSIYYSRNTFKKMIKQAYGNGKWNLILFKKDKSALSLRHLVPFIFDMSILVFLILGFLFPVVLVLLLGEIALHLLIGISYAIKSTKSFLQIMIMPWIFLSLHISYGWGSIVGFLKKI